MIVNPGKFKAILPQKNKRNTSEYPVVLTSHEFKTQEPITLLGVTPDHKLSFEEHVSDLCQKDSAELNAPKRLRAFMSHQTRKSMVQLGHLQNHHKFLSNHVICIKESQNSLGLLQN